jgi:hypothetical protein
MGMNLKSWLAIVLVCGATVITGSVSAHASTIVYTGYFDLPPPAGGNTNALPNPWLGSPNTTFLGSTSVAGSSDPDEAAVRIQNTGSTAVTLGQGFVMGGISAWDSLIGAGGLVIAPGANVILSGTSTQSTDGSENIFSNAIVKVVIDGKLFNFNDTGVLVALGLSSANETSPWTQIGEIGADTAATPLPAALPFFATGLGVMGLFARRRKKKVVTIAA